MTAKKASKSNNRGARESARPKDTAVGRPMVDLLDLLARSRPAREAAIRDLGGNLPQRAVYRSMATRSGQIQVLEKLGRVYREYFDYLRSEKDEVEVGLAEDGLPRHSLVERIRSRVGRKIGHDVMMAHFIVCDLLADLRTPHKAPQTKAAKRRPWYQDAGRAIDAGYRAGVRDTLRALLPWTSNVQRLRDELHIAVGRSHRKTSRHYVDALMGYRSQTALKAWRYASSFIEEHLALVRGTPAFRRETKKLANYLDRN